MAWGRPGMLEAHWRQLAQQVVVQEESSNSYAIMLEIVDETVANRNSVLTATIICLVVIGIAPS